MAIRRGTLYSITGVPSVSGYLVLSNDRWNSVDTQEAAGALVYDSDGPMRVRLAQSNAFVGELLAVPKDALGNPLVQFAPGDLRPVEERVCDILALRELHQRPPSAPAAQPGAINYPLWSQIYYAGPPRGDPPQKKRWVTSSIDAYNKLMGGAVSIRTTTQRKPGPGFPELSDGTVAVAMTPTFFLKTQIRMDPRHPRPDPKQFFIADMASIAEGLVDALDLHYVV